jgi:cell division protease FtsH
MRKNILLVWVFFGLVVPFYLDAKDKKHHTDKTDRTEEFSDKDHDDNNDHEVSKKDNWDKALIGTLIGTGILGSVVGSICACYQAHRDSAIARALTKQEQDQLKRDHFIEPGRQQGQGQLDQDAGEKTGNVIIGDPKKKIEDFIAGSIAPEVTEIISFLKTPEKFNKLGARMPRGVLLVGPPGTGKTSIARAIANSAGCVFIHVNASEFIEKYVGTGASRIRELFRLARQAIKEGKSKSVIIFIDEIDAVGGKRNDGECREYQQTINQLLTEMDGFNKEESIVVIAATNRPDILDPALLRPGRFDRKVMVGLPDKESRRKILEYYCKKNKCPLAKDVDFVYLAEHTDRMSGAELQNVVNEAAIQAARKDADTITQQHFADTLVRLRPQGTSTTRCAY